MIINEEGVGSMLKTKTLTFLYILCILTLHSNVNAADSDSQELNESAPETTITALETSTEVETSIETADETEVDKLLKTDTEDKTENLSTEPEEPEDEEEDEEPDCD